MKSIITLLLLFGSAMLFAQQEDFLAPDYALIEKNINDKDSEYYYPLLMEKLEKMIRYSPMNNTGICTTDMFFMKITIPMEDFPNKMKSMGFLIWKHSARRISNGRFH